MLVLSLATRAVIAEKQMGFHNSARVQEGKDLLKGKVDELSIAQYGHPSPIPCCLQ